MVITDKSQFPLFDVMFQPILETYGDNRKYKTRELTQIVYQKYYSEYSLDVMAGKSGPVIFDRIHRANYGLFAGKFIDRVGYGEYQITEKGINFLKSNQKLTYKYLTNQDEDYKNSSWHTGKNTDITDKQDSKEEKVLSQTEMTAQEMLDYAFKRIEEPKKEELLQRCRETDPYLFERLVGNLCEAMGYGTFVETPKSHDGGIDGVIKGDSLGFEKIYIQAKRYAENNIVQGKEMQNFVGALASSGVKKGIFVTTSSFGENAKMVANNASRSGQDIILIDGELLTDLMFKYNVGVQTKNVYQIKYIDEDFFQNFS